MATVTEGVLHPSMRYTGDLLLGDSALFSSLGEIKGPLHSNFNVFLKEITQKMSFDSIFYFYFLIEKSPKNETFGFKEDTKKMHIKDSRLSCSFTAPLSTHLRPKDRCSGLFLCHGHNASAKMKPPCRVLRVVLLSNLSL